MTRQYKLTLIKIIAECIAFDKDPVFVELMRARLAQIARTEIKEYKVFC